MKTQIAIIAGLFMLTACGQTPFGAAPTIKKRALAAGAEGTVDAFNAVIERADTLEGEDAGEDLAGLIVRSQLDLLRVNGSSSALSTNGETGVCLMMWRKVISQVANSQTKSRSVAKVR